MERLSCYKSCRILLLYDRKTILTILPFFYNAAQFLEKGQKKTPCPAVEPDREFCACALNAESDLNV
jgi:hypothetical protein